MEKRALLLPDVDEGGLNAGENSFDSTEVDVAHRAAVVRAVDQQLGEPVVFQDSHSGFPLASVNQNFALQVRNLVRPRAGSGAGAKAWASMLSASRGEARPAARLTGAVASGDVALRANRLNM